MKLAGVLLAVALLFCAWIFLFPGGSDKESAKRVACLSNLKQLALATEIYRESADGRLPSPTWWPQLKAIMKDPEFMGCPVVYVETRKTAGHAMNVTLVGARYEKIESPDQAVLFFETDAIGEGVVTNLAARNRDRHQGKGSNVSYADGHAKFILKENDP